MSRAVLSAGLAGALTAIGLAEAVSTRRPRTAARGRWVLRLAGLGRRLGIPAVGERLVARVAAAGAPLGMGEADLVAVKAGGLLVGAGVAALVAATVPARLAVLAGIAFPAAGFLAPDLWLARRARDRGRQMERELPDVLELVRVGLEAGLPLTRALAEVGRRRRGLLASELRRAAERIELGTGRDAALSALASRCPLAGIPALVVAIERGERLGAPLAGTLSAQARDARAERARRVREASERAAPKIQLVVALGLVPSVLLLVAAALLAALMR